MRKRNSLIFIFLFMLLALFFNSCQPIEENQTYIFDKQWGTFGTGEGEFDSPSGIAIYYNETNPELSEVLIADTNNNRIQKFDLYGNFIMSFSQTGERAGGLTRPTGITVCAVGQSAGNYKIFVADTDNNRIVEFDSAGNFIKEFGETITKAGGLTRPTGITVCAVGVIVEDFGLFVADTNNNRIVEFDSAGNFIREFGKPSTKAGGLTRPTGITVCAVDGSAEDYNILVADTDNNRIVKFSSAGEIINSFNSESGQLNKPKDVKVSSTGKIFVADTNNSTIKILDTNGSYIKSIGSLGTGEGTFNQPASLVLLAEEFYVADTNNHLIQSFRLMNTETPSPEMYVKTDRGVLVSGKGKYNFANVSVGSSSSIVTFTIKNIGSADLTISGVELASGDIGDFILDNSTTLNTLAPKTETTFTLTFHPLSTGNKSAVVSIGNNDSDENPYTFTIKGHGN